MTLQFRDRLCIRIRIRIRIRGLYLQIMTAFRRQVCRLAKL